MPSALHLHREGRIIRLELSSPDGYPRLSISLLEEIGGHVGILVSDASCAGIVIHGSEKCFAAGAEIGELESLTGAAALPFARRGQLVFESIARSPKAVVAAVTGYCLGGGLDLALACRWRLATPEAVFGHPGATLGLLSGWGGTQRLPRLISRSRALELLLRGEPISAEEALARGLVDELLPAARLLERARELAQMSGVTADLTSAGQVD